MRDRIAALVAAIEPWDELERAHRDDVLAWIASGATLTRRVAPATPPKHLVSYYVLLDRARRSLMLVDHRKAGLWLPGGGHVEPDEHPDATVIREMREELRYDGALVFPEPLFLTVTETVGATAGHVDVSLWYVVDASADADFWFDEEECSRIDWFPLDALPLDRCDPHLERFAAKMAHALKYRTSYPSTPEFPNARGA
jgi:8-oxo-dGTP diphosphatase